MVDRNEEWQTSGGRRRSSQEDCEDCHFKTDTSKVVVRSVAIRGTGIR